MQKVPRFELHADIHLTITKRIQRNASAGSRAETSASPLIFDWQNIAKMLAEILRRLLEAGGNETEREMCVQQLFANPGEVLHHMHSSSVTTPHIWYLTIY